MSQVGWSVAIPNNPFFFIQENVEYRYAPLNLQVMNPTDNITFYQRFREDILSGKKTITIRDKGEAHFTAGQILSVATYEANEWFCNIKAHKIESLRKSDFNEQHALNENMTLEELYSVIEEIYPNEDQFYLIEFDVIQ